MKDAKVLLSYAIQLLYQYNNNYGTSNTPYGRFYRIGILWFISSVILFSEATEENLFLALFTIYFLQTTLSGI
jgi:hypothetical protein